MLPVGCTLYASGRGGYHAHSSRFDTRNNFHGGQVGARLHWQDSRLSADLAGTVALGVNYQNVNVTTSTLAPIMFAISGNLGERSSTQFSVIPSVELKLGYDVLRNLRATAGYSFTYWSNVVRPGDQINLLANLNTPPTTFQKFESTDFWMHGLSVGAEFRW